MLRAAEQTGVATQDRVGGQDGQRAMRYSVLARPTPTGGGLSIGIWFALFDFVLNALATSPLGLRLSWGLAIAALDLTVWLQLGLVTLLASAVQGAIGFAFTLLSVSFFLLILQSSEAVQVLLVLNLVISLALVRHLWRDVPLELWRVLAAGAAIGLPLGLAAFAYASLPVLKLGVAAVVLIFTGALAVQRSAGRPAPASAHPRSASAVLVGVAAGAMTTALGMPGPVIVLYLTGIGMEKAVLRAVSLTLFAALYALALLLQATTVGVPSQVWVTAATLVPLAAAGAWAGHVGTRFINERLFRHLVLLLLGATGASLLITTLTE